MTVIHNNPKNRVIGAAQFCMTQISNLGRQRIIFDALLKLRHETRTGGSN